MRLPIASILTGAAVLASTASPRAAELGRPAPWQMGLQESVTPVMDSITTFHNGLLLPLITVISLFVLGLLVYVMIKFNARANPEPSRTTHNTLVEVLWTVIPVLILVVIAVPSFRLVYLQRNIPAADFTIKATGNQWYWSYEYPDHGDISFDALRKDDAELKDGEPRLLATDSPVIVPINKTVRVIVTANDVLHAWTVPAFGSKIDAVPGRLNEEWFKATREGVFYGQCSELCGKDHAFMPIEVHVVPEADFNAWIEKAKTAGVGEAYKLLAEREQSRDKMAKAASAGN